MKRTFTPPAVPLELWRNVYAAADAFGSLQPWTWMDDSRLLGLRDPGNGEVLLCSVLGALRSVFALIVYRGDSGRRWVLKTCSYDEPDLDEAHQQDCVKVEFVPRGKLQAEDKAQIKQLAFKPALLRGSVWPQFRAFQPARFPWFLNQAEANTLLYALPRARAYVVLLREHPELFDGRGPTDVPFWPATPGFTGPLRAEHLDWHPLLVPPDPAVETVSLTEEEQTQFAALPQPGGLELEIDAFFTPARILDREPPWIPKAALAVATDSGFVAGYAMGKGPDESMETVAGAALIQALTNLGARPATVRVRKPRLAQALEPVVRQLGFTITETAALPQLLEARADLERALSRPPRGQGS